MQFRKYLFESDFNYLSVGHIGNKDSYVYKDGELYFASEHDTNPDDLHDLGKDHHHYKGRIDHDKKMASIVSNSLIYDIDEIKLLTYQLKEKFPNYQIWLFGKGSPKQL